MRLLSGQKTDNMKRYLLFLFIGVAFFSCKKREEDCTCPAPVTPVSTSANSYLQLGIGNYWIYDQYTIDTNSVEMLTGQDSAYVWGDTVINGNTYYKFYDLYMTHILRDSAGFIIDTSSYKYFTNSIFNIPVTFYYWNNLGYSQAMTLSSPVAVTVPAGAYFAYDWQTTVHLTDPNYPWNPIRYGHSYFAYGVGKVKESYLFLNSPNSYERRLIRYHIQ